MLRVLHIEDDEESRRLVGKVLAAAGFEVVEASDGLSGVRKALECRPDLILLDIDLPDMDGYEVTLKLRGELAGRNVPIIALSGGGDRRTVMAVGCDGYLSKPIDVDRFPSEVRSHIGKARGAADDDESPLLAQSRKLAARLQAKIEELEIANRQLLESEKVRGEFYRNLSHELSTPLTPAIGYLNMLLEGELGPLGEKQRRALESVDRGVGRVRAVVENLLDITALSTGKMSFFPRYYDFYRKARESIRQCRGRIDAEGVEITEAIPSDERRGYGDPDKLQRAMVQLIENALKFCEGECRVHVIARREGGRLSFLVYDSGKGIPREEREAIFRTFYQIDGSPTREHGGAGLGLALARRIVERFGGEIWAESPPRGAPEDLSWARTVVGLWVPRVMAGETPPDGPP